MHPASSSLPSLMIPCPGCCGRIAFKQSHAADRDMEMREVTFACADCGAELVRSELHRADSKAA